MSNCERYEEFYVPGLVYARPGTVDAIVGLQRGDEGKGRFVDLMAYMYDMVIRGNGGANAGHQIVPEDAEPVALHQLPSGVAYPRTLNVIGTGVYLDPTLLSQEITQARAAGIVINLANLAISETAQLVLPHHKWLDVIRERGSKGQGSTKRGIAFAASDKYLREGVRFEDASLGALSYAELAEEGLRRVHEELGFGDVREIGDLVRQWGKAILDLEPYMTDTVELVNDRLDNGASALAEGAQAFWLDVNHGMYPYVTSSPTTAAGLFDGIGVSPARRGTVTGVAKLVKTHVGGGPFVTEITDDDVLLTRLRGEKTDVDGEYGKSTGRPRRVGYPDVVELKNAVRVNGVDHLAISKADHAARYGDMMKVALAYEENGVERTSAPSSARRIANCRPIYTEMPTWGEVGNVRRFEHLPTESINYFRLLEERLKTPVTQIGVGAARSAVILR